MRHALTSRFRLLHLSLALGVFLITAVPARSAEELSLADFQTTMFSFATLTGSQSLLTRLKGLTAEEWTSMYETFPNKAAFATAVAELQARSGAGAGTQVPMLKSLRPQFTAVEFTPLYPSGPGYDAFTATMPGLGLVFDNDLPGFQDDRCDASAEGNARIVYSTAQVAAIIGDVACNSIVVILGEGTNLPACIVAGVLHETAQAAQIVIDQCGYQTALVDSAEIEATYENTRRIIGTLNNVDAQVHDFVALQRVELQVVALQTLGCSQGYWKNHTEQWSGGGAADLAPTYEPSTLFDAVFGDGADGVAGLKNNVTLLGVLQATGGGTTAQARNAVTLLLNDDAVNNGRSLPCDDAAAGDVGDFAPILGPYRRKFLLSSAEAGEAVDVDLVHVLASTMNPVALGFTDVTAATTASSVKTGVQLLVIELPDALKNARGFEIKVIHDHHRKSVPILGAPEGVDVVHYGTTLFHQSHDQNVGMGQ